MLSYYKAKRELLRQQRVELEAFERRKTLWQAAHRMSQDWEQLGGRVYASPDNFFITLYGSNTVHASAFAELMHYYIYTRKRFEVAHRWGEEETDSRLSVQIKDTKTGASLDFDLAKDTLGTCKILKTTREEIKEIISNRYICEDVNGKEVPV